MDSAPLMSSANTSEAPQHNVPLGHFSRSPSPVSSLQSDRTSAPQHGFVAGKQPTAQSTANLTHSWWAWWIVVPYALITVTSWTIICVQTRRPLATGSYDSYWDRRYTNDTVQTIYETNQDIFRVARVLQAIAGVLAIPITSAVCARAAIVFVQAPQRLKGGLSLRQMITLSDQGWTDPMVYYRLVTSGFKRYGSLLLLLSMLLSVLGAIISPLQSIYLKTSTTKTPTNRQIMARLPSISDLMRQTSDINLVSMLTRSAITSTLAEAPQSRLWTRGQTPCVDNGSQFCVVDGNFLNNMSTLLDPFFAPLPNGTSTGLIKQYLPRINSSVTRTYIPATQFPTACEDVDGAFYAHYFHDGAYNSTNFGGNWSVIACMPANQTSSLWRNTNDRQDISEELYLNISIHSVATGSDGFLGLYRYTMNTTLGYFELPNYANDQTAGPLLDKSPWGNTTSQPPPQSGHYRRNDGGFVTGMSNSTVILESVSNKGPLLALSMALFGDNSFIANRFHRPESYVRDVTNTQMWSDIDHGTNELLFQPTCTDQEPMMRLIDWTNSWDMTEDRGLYPGCIKGKNNNLDMVHRQVGQWLMSFGPTYPEENVRNAFEAAAFLANEAWLTTSRSNYGNLFVSYDMGADTELPVVQSPGILVISILLGIHLVGLSAMAYYASRRPSWASTLDAFAMIRIGASMRDDVPLMYARNADQVRILDEAPGWIGDASHGVGDLAILGLGSPAVLTGKRKVQCYDETTEVKNRGPIKRW